MQVRTFQAALVALVMVFVHLFVSARAEVLCSVPSSLTEGNNLEVTCTGTSSESSVALSVLDDVTNSFVYISSSSSSTPSALVYADDFNSKKTVKVVVTNAGSEVFSENFLVSITPQEANQTFLSNSSRESYVTGRLNNLLSVIEDASDVSDHNTIVQGLVASINLWERSQLSVSNSSGLHSFMPVLLGLNDMTLAANDSVVTGVASDAFMTSTLATMLTWASAYNTSFASVQAAVIAADSNTTFLASEGIIALLASVSSKYTLLNTAIRTTILTQLQAELGALYASSNPFIFSQTADNAVTALNYVLLSASTDSSVSASYVAEVSALVESITNTLLYKLVSSSTSGSVSISSSTVNTTITKVSTATLASQAVSFGGQASVPFTIPGVTGAAVNIPANIASLFAGVTSLNIVYQSISPSIYSARNTNRGRKPSVNGVNYAPVSINLNSPVIGFTLYDANAGNLNTPLTVDISGSGSYIYLTFPHSAINNDSIVPLCQYWDTSALTWDESGCSLYSSLSTETSASCRCTHLTDFGVNPYESVSTTVKRKNAFLEITQTSVRDHPYALIWILIWTAIYVVFAIFFLIVDKRRDADGLRILASQWKDPNPQGAEEKRLGERYNAHSYPVYRMIEGFREYYLLTAPFMRDPTDSFSCTARWTIFWVLCFTSWMISALWHGLGYGEYKTESISVIVMAIMVPITALTHLIYAAAIAGRLRRAVYKYAEHIAYLRYKDQDNSLPAESRFRLSANIPESEYSNILNNIADAAGWKGKRNSARLHQLLRESMELNPEALVYDYSSNSLFSFRYFATWYRFLLNVFVFLWIGVCYMLIMVYVNQFSLFSGRPTGEWWVSAFLTNLYLYFIYFFAIVLVSLCCPCFFKKDGPDMYADRRLESLNSVSGSTIEMKCSPVPGSSEASREVTIHV